MTDQNKQVDRIVSEMKGMDEESLKRVFQALQKEDVFGGCPMWTCSIKHHYHMGT